MNGGGEGGNGPNPVWPHAKYAQLVAGGTPGVGAIEEEDYGVPSV